jgi:hypothetical protein
VSYSWGKNAVTGEGSSWGKSSVSSDSSSWGTSIHTNINPPEISNISPPNEKIDVDPEFPVSFSITDDNQIILADTIVYINEKPIFRDSAWVDGWSASSYSVNASNGYDFIILPDGGWEVDARVDVRVVSVDNIDLELDYSWYFDVGGEEFPFSIYRMLPKQTREMDSRSPGLLETIIESEGAINDHWEEKVYDRAVAVKDLQDPYKIPSKHLPWLKSQVGLTRDLSFETSEDDLRTIIANAARFFTAKPTELSLEYAIRMVTGNRFSIRGYFDFRMEAEKTLLTEMIENYDPHLVDFPGVSTSGNELHWCYINTSYPCTHKFWIEDLPQEHFPNEKFVTTNQFEWLEIVEWQDDQSFEGFYKIDYLVATTDVGYIDPTGSAGPNPTSDKYGKWRLWRGNGDLITEIRLVDEPSGLGVVDRELLKSLLNLVRPVGERLDLIYLEFLDAFTRINNLGQWTIVGSVEPTVPSPGGEVVMPANAFMYPDKSFASSWEERIVSYKVKGGSTTVWELIFLYVDSDNYYFVKVDYDAKTVSVYKKVSGSDTLLGSTTVAILLPDYYDVFRITFVYEGGSDALIRVNYEGDIILEVNDAPASMLTGNIAIASTGTTSGYISRIEVLKPQCETDRVGPVT